MKWGMTNNEYRAWTQARREMLSDGFSWFAWYPVSLEDGRTVWLEQVYARVDFRNFYGPKWEYRVLTQGETK